jgi:O2-independent ubiquinone biosynthesis accessory factor UbiT
LVSCTKFQRVQSFTEKGCRSHDAPQTFTASQSSRTDCQDSRFIDETCFLPAISHSSSGIGKAAETSQPLADGDLDFLQGNWLKIEISDHDLQCLFSCGSLREVLIRQYGESDVCIRGSLKSFILLAARKEDPDTLFFQRDLVIEGDTELGLEVKNLLDSLDLDELPPELLFALRSSAEYMVLFSD